MKNGDNFWLNILWKIIPLLQNIASILQTDKSNATKIFDIQLLFYGCKEEVKNIAKKDVENIFAPINNIDKRLPKMTQDIYLFKHRIEVKFFLN